MSSVNQKTVSANQEFLREIALNSYGYGSRSGEAGGRGNIGLVNDAAGNPRVVKFNTSVFTSTPKHGTKAYEKSLEASNQLRALLINIAQTSDLSEKTLQEIRDKLGVDQDNKLKDDLPLLTRKITAGVVKLIDKDIWSRVKADKQKSAYSSKNIGSADSKDFIGMSDRIESRSFGGSAVALDKMATAKGEKDALLSHSIAKTVEEAQGKRETAVSFEAARTFEDAAKEAAEQFCGPEKDQNAYDTFIKDFARYKDDFIKLAGRACGLKGDASPNAAEVDKKFAEIREDESKSTRIEGLMRKTLANLLVSCMRNQKKLSEVTSADVDQAREAAEASLPQEGSEDARDIETLNTLAIEFGDVSPRPEFSRAFTTSRQRKDAIAILRKLKGTSGKTADGLNFDVPDLVFPLIQKAVIEARKLQPDDKELSDDVIYEALTGKLPAENGKKDLFAAVGDRLNADVYAPYRGDTTKTQRANEYAFSASAFGLKYDSILGVLHEPGRMPTVHDFYDTSVRLVRLPDKARSTKFDGDDKRYDEIAYRRPASRYYFDEEDEVNKKDVPFLDSKDHYPSGKDNSKKDGWEKTITSFMNKFETEENKKMVTDLLSQHVGEPYFISMFGCDTRMSESDPLENKYMRDFRNYSDFRFKKESAGESKTKWRVVVTPNREALEASGRVDKDIDYEIEFLIESDGTARVTKQWFGHVGQKAQ